MQRLALEEHFEAPGIEREDYDGAIFRSFDATAAAIVHRRLNDFDDERLAMMDACGIAVTVLSQTAPGVQVERDAVKAVRLAREANDFLAERIRRHPTRYAGFAHLALQDPAAAADELQRCVEQLRFCGALINHHTLGEYLDADRFAIVWERASSLEVPIYLHPADPFDKPAVYQGSEGLKGPVWPWNCETSAHALRLIFAGTLDRFPGARLILGHMGETIPFYLWRLDSRAALVLPQMKRPPSQVVRERIVITTSGVCSNAALRCSIEEMGIDNVLFSTDYPYEDAQIAADWIDAAPLTDEERAKVCYANARRILKNLPG
jgi:2,3-dihydroxybenzoate decarboxylase